VPQFGHALKSAPNGSTAPRAEGSPVAPIRELAQQLLRCSHPAFQFRQSFLSECDHAVGDRLVANLFRRRSRRNDPAECVGHPHHFVDAGSAAIAGVIALVATGRLVKHNSRGIAFRDAEPPQYFEGQRVFPATVGTELPDEPLCNDAGQGRCGG
jgi:hypothetical protein